MSHHDVNILVVDDTHDNLQLLSNILAEERFQVRPVSNGKEALSAVQAKTPDLILLDIMLPDMDGYTVCKELKANVLTHDVPIIFICALGEVFDKVKGFALGAVDYVTGPFEAEEVLARVRTHLHLRLMQRQLHDQNLQLQREIVGRKRAENALQTANATKDTFFSILNHDVRSPFSGLLGSIELALNYFEQLSPDEHRQNLVRIKKSADMFYALLENLLTWARVQRGRMEYHPENIPVSALVAHLIELCAEAAEQKQITLQHNIPQSTSVYADINMLNIILRNIVSNALKFTPLRGTITLSARQCAHEVEITVTDTGIGIGIAGTDIANLVRVDRKTTTLGTAGEHGMGLGLPLCQDLIEKNQGTLQIASIPEKGTTVRITLPASVSVPEASPPRHDLRHEHIITRMKALPEDLKADLHSAVDAFNLTQTKTLIEAIRQDHQELAEALTQYAKQFQFEELQRLCQKAKGT